MTHLKHFALDVEGYVFAHHLPTGGAVAVQGEESATPSPPDAFIGSADVMPLAGRSAALGFAAGKEVPGE